MDATSTATKPRVSVIIPSYNTAALIPACLDSVLSQTFQDFEVIVVNDGSPDTPQLEAALKPYMARIVYVPQENKRAAGARNTAIERARGEFLAFLDSDDSWLPGHLSSQIECFRKDPSAEMVYADALMIGDSRKRTFMQRCPSEGPASFEALVVERCQIPISTVVARKTAILRAGPFNESLPRCDDWDMWLRTSFFGAKIIYRREVQARLNIGRPDSLGLSRAKMAEAAWKILEGIGNKLPLNEKRRVLVSQRAADLKAAYLCEEAKIQLHEGRTEKAKKLFAEANKQLRSVKLGMVIQGLNIAPRATKAIVSLRQRLLDASVQA